VHQFGPGPVLQYRPSRFQTAGVFRPRSARQRAEPPLFRPLPASLRYQRRVSLLPRELHAPPMPPPVSEASSRHPRCDLTRATAARPPITSRPTLLTSCHHRSTRCTCSHRPCTLPPHSRSGGKAIHSFFPSYRRAPATPLELPSPPCLGHRRLPPPVLLRPHLLHLEHRPSPMDLNVHFNARLDPFSGLPRRLFPA
jgi:hypothetical protein